MNKPIQNASIDLNENFHNQIFLIKKILKFESLGHRYLEINQIYTCETFKCYQYEKLFLIKCKYCESKCFVCMEEENLAAFRIDNKYNQEIGRKICDRLSVLK